MVGIVLASILGAAYVAYVIWIAFGSNAGTQPKPPPRQGLGLVLVALGAPLVLGGSIAAIAVPTWRGAALIAAAGGGVAVVVSAVLYGRDGQAATTTGYRTGPGRAAVSARSAQGLVESQPGWVPVAIGLLLTVIGCVVIWRSGPAVRLGGILAVAIGVGLLASGMAPTVAGAQATAARGWWRRDRAVLGVLAVVAASASAVVLFVAAGVIRDSPAFVRRYGVQVEAKPVVGSCTTTFYRSRPPRRTCNATWRIDGETVEGRLIFTRDAMNPLGQARPAHVLDARAATAYTAPLEATPPPDGSYLALGRIHALPLLPAFIVHVLAWIAVRRWLAARIVRATR